MLGYQSIVQIIFILNILLNEISCYQTQKDNYISYLYQFHNNFLKIILRSDMKKVERRLNQARKNPGDLFNEAKRRFQYKPKSDTKFSYNNSKKKILTPSCESQLLTNTFKKTPEKQDQSNLFAFKKSSNLVLNEANNKSIEINSKDGKQENGIESKKYHHNKNNQQQKYMSQGLENHKIPSSSTAYTFYRQPSRNLNQAKFDDSHEQFFHQRMNKLNITPSYDSFAESSENYPKLFETRVRSSERKSDEEKIKNISYYDTNNNKTKKTMIPEFEVTILNIQEPLEEQSLYYKQYQQNPNTFKSNKSFSQFSQSSKSSSKKVPSLKKMRLEDIEQIQITIKDCNDNSPLEQNIVDSRNNKRVISARTPSYPSTTQYNSNPIKINSSESRKQIITTTIGKIKKNSKNNQPYKNNNISSIISHQNNKNISQMLKNNVYLDNQQQPLIGAKNNNLNFLNNTSPIKNKYQQDHIANYESRNHHSSFQESSILDDGKPSKVKFLMEATPTKSQRYVSPQRNSSNSPLKKSCLKERSVSKYQPQVIQQVSEEELGHIQQATQIQLKLKQIFKSLDSQKSGSIHKLNCNTNYLNDEFRYLIGSILSKIKYQNKRYLENQFLNHAKQIISKLQNDQITKLLKASIFNRFIFQENNLQQFRNFEQRRSFSTFIKHPTNKLDQSKKKDFKEQQQKNLQGSQKGINFTEQYKSQPLHKLKNKPLSQSYIAQEPEILKQSQKMSEISKYLKINEILPSIDPYMRQSSYLLQNQSIQKGNNSSYYDFQRQEFIKIDLLNEKLTKYIFQNQLKTITKSERVDNIRLEFAELRKHLRE